MSVIEHDDILEDYLSKRQPGEIVIVQKFDYIQRETTVYGEIGGAVAFPKNRGQIISSNRVPIDHITGNSKPI